MIIAGYAVGANLGHVYIRAEYPLAIKRLAVALKQAKAKGFLGDNILDSGFSFKIKIKQGAGAFVCGEETALIESIQGNRGMPRPRPPYPAAKGLWDKPTNVNNVETFGNLPVIYNLGVENYKTIGTEKSKGTKIFALTGKVKNTGLVEVMDEDTCMVDLARFFLEFTQDESCGKCAPCRIGTKRMLEILTRITRGQGREGDIERLIKLGTWIKETALCGLGQTAPNPVLTTIRYFRDE
jgi:NADH:ubiquinone oxidoreductase subunit F (NADH-binding)